MTEAASVRARWDNRQLVLVSRLTIRSATPSGKLPATFDFGPSESNWRISPESVTKELSGQPPNAVSRPTRGDDWPAAVGYAMDSRPGGREFGWAKSNASFDCRRLRTVGRDAGGCAGDLWSPGAADPQPRGGSASGRRFPSRHRAVDGHRSGHVRPKAKRPGSCATPPKASRKSLPSARRPNSFPTASNALFDRVFSRPVRFGQLKPFLDAPSGSRRARHRSGEFTVA